MTDKMNKETAGRLPEEEGTKRTAAQGGAAKQGDNKSSGTAGEGSAPKAADKQTAAPKKKNLAFVVRPQNSKDRNRLQGGRTGQKSRQRPEQGRRRPAGEDGRRDGQGNRPARGGAQQGEERVRHVLRPAGTRPVRNTGAQGNRPVRTAPDNGRTAPAGAGVHAQAEGSPAADVQDVRQDTRRPVTGQETRALKDTEKMAVSASPSTEQSTSAAAARTEKAAAQPAEQAGAKVPENASDQAGTKAPEKAQAKAAEKASEKAVDKPQEKAGAAKAKRPAAPDPMQGTRLPEKVGRTLNDIARETEERIAQAQAERAARKAAEEKAARERAEKEAAEAAASGRTSGRTGDTRSGGRQDRGGYASGNSRTGSRSYSSGTGTGRQGQGSAARGDRRTSGTGDTRGGYRQDRGTYSSGNSRTGGRSYSSGTGTGRQGTGSQGGRTDNRRSDFRRNAPAQGAPSGDQQKNQRNRARDKERDNRKRDFQDEAFNGRGRRGGRRQKGADAAGKPLGRPEEKKEQIKQIVLPETLTIKELADKMKLAPSVIIKKLFLQGKMFTVNDEIDYDTAEEIAMEFNVLCEKEEVVDVIEELLKEEEEDDSLKVKRPPVVCVMGHVDHGKTSLLDAIRHSNVTDREAGGITQHIGASVVEINGEKITFLDTPGHEAFTAMRMRGANSTDIAILVVAADDGVMPQTVEAINHAKAAGIEIIVAVNKIDKPGANVERVKQELTEYELVPEDWGGSTVCVPVSAKTHEGIQDLLEMILLTAEVMELKANPNRQARGLVIEAKLDKGKGPVATVLVQKGTLHVGDAVAAGSVHGRVRAMTDDKGRRVKEAGPSDPVEIIGLNDVPNAGEVFVGCETEKEARAFADTFISEGKVKLLEETKSRMSLEDLFSQIQEGNLKELDIVVKADVQGSVEAIKQSLLKLSNDEVVVKIIHSGVGAINESDAILASASNAIIIGFNVRPDATAKDIAEREGVDLRLYNVIYNAIEDVEAAMKGMLDPIFEEKVIGHAEVRQTFKASGVGTIAGGYILDGIFERGCSVRLSREDKVLFDGPLASLKRFKDDVKEVRAGYECGFVLQGFNDIQEGDQAEAYKMVEVERK